MKSISSISLILLLFQFLGYSQNKIVVENKNQVTDKDADNFTILGKVLMGENLLEDGSVFLLSNTKSINDVYGNTEILNGYFSFENINANVFALYVIPKLNFDFFHFPKYLPTYSGNVCNWQNAFINNNSLKDNEKYDIQLQKYSKPFYGEKKISGKVVYDRSYRGSRIIPISILLLNKDKVPMDFRVVTDEDTDFLFENLPEGKYFIHLEVPWVNSDNYEISLKTQDVNKQIDFKINENDVEFEIPYKNENFNPTVNENGLEFFIQDDTNSSIICELTDLSGKSILKNIYTTNNILINTSGISTGIYLLRARTYSNSIVKTAKVYINNH